jgi:hypothetical protein
METRYYLFSFSRTKNKINNSLLYFLGYLFSFSRTKNKINNSLLYFLGYLFSFCRTKNKRGQILNLSPFVFPDSINWFPKLKNKGNKVILALRHENLDA